MRLEEITESISKMDEHGHLKEFPVFLPEKSEGSPIDHELAFKAIGYLNGIHIWPIDDLSDDKPYMSLSEEDFRKYIWNPCLEARINSLINVDDEKVKTDWILIIDRAKDRFPNNLNRLSINDAIKNFKFDSLICREFGYGNVEKESQTTGLFLLKCRAAIKYIKEDNIPNFFKTECDLTKSAFTTINRLIDENHISHQDIIPKKASIWNYEYAEKLEQKYHTKPIKIDFTPPKEEDEKTAYFDKLESYLQDDNHKNTFWKEYSSVNKEKNSELYNYFKQIKFDYFTNKELDNYPALKEIVNQDINKEYTLDDMLNSMSAMEKTTGNENISNDEVGVID